MPPVSRGAFFIAKRFVLSLDPEKFRLLMDALLLASGLTMLWTALNQGALSPAWHASASVRGIGPRIESGHILDITTVI